MDHQKLNQIAGMFYGFVVGDALGTTLEFKSRDTYPHMTDMVGKGAFNLKPGQWTDDTSMMLASCATIAGEREFSPEALMAELAAWVAGEDHVHVRGCFDIGAGTSAVVRNFVATGRITAPSKRNGGNGALCRAIPFVAKHVDRPSLAVDGAETQAKVTNGDQRSIRAVELYAKLLWNAIRAKEGTPLNVGDAYEGVRRADISSSGYAPNTLDAAVWAVQSSDSFEEAVLKACNLGWDADSVGAVAGALAGARWGFEAIPAEWLEKLAEPDMLDDALASVLPQDSGILYHRYNPRKLDDLLPLLRKAREGTNKGKGFARSMPRFHD